MRKGLIIKCVAVVAGLMPLALVGAVPPASAPAQYDPAVTQRELDQLKADPQLSAAERVHRQEMALQALNRDQFLAYVRFAIPRIAPDRNHVGPRLFYSSYLLELYRKGPGSTLQNGDLLKEVVDPAMPAEWRVLEGVALSQRGLPIADLEQLAKAMLDIGANGQQEADGLLVELVTQTEKILQQIQWKLAPGSPEAATAGRNAVPMPLPPEASAGENRAAIQRLAGYRQELLRIAKRLGPEAQSELSGRIGWMRSLRARQIVFTGGAAPGHPLPRTARRISGPATASARRWRPAP